MKSAHDTRALTLGWAPQPGSQRAFLAAPCGEVLYHGSRGGGKTTALIMDFAQGVGRGWGAHWRGVLFREEATQLSDVIAKTLRWFPRLFPGARYISSGERKWVFPDGAELLLRPLRRLEDYGRFHGHEYSWIGFEELTAWAAPDAYLAMMSCLRSSGPATMPRKLRATCNPYGPGRGWVKARFIDPAAEGTPITDQDGRVRLAIRSSIHENRILLQQDPGYLAQLQADPDLNRRKAWLEGSWDAVSGGIFEGQWDAQASVLQPFAVPKAWRVDRAFDWGASRPYAVGWFAESDGTPARLADGQERTFARGSIFLISELYGWTGTPNEGLRDTNTQIARRILEAEAGLKGTLLQAGQSIYPGPADTAIFDLINGDSYADEMARVGVSWEKAAKGPGSRVQGWQKLGGLFHAAQKQPMEAPGFFVFATCRNFLRTVPTLARDSVNPDDVDSAQEDHLADCVRYRVTRPKPTGVGAVHLPRVY